MESLSSAPDWLTVAAAAVLGLIVGSFLNVVVHRLPTMLERRWTVEARETLGEEPEPPSPEAYHLGWPPSQCPQCGHRLRAAENVPLLSYLLQRGRCRGCGCRIALRYPVLEGLTAAGTASVAAVHGPSLEALGPLVLTWTLIAGAALDYEHYILPDALTLPLLWGGLLWSTITVSPPTPSHAIIGAASGYGAMWAIYHGHRLITGREGMGYGDFKLTAALGAWLGWQSLPAVVLLGAIGGLVAALLLALGHRALSQPLPFGPFLAGAGWLIAMLMPGAGYWHLLL